MAVPIGGEDGVRGILLLVREAGGHVFTDKEIEPLRGFAAQAAVAMELAERRQDAEQIALLEDRDRIARDLHDLAIQRLFATGMTLQSAGRFIEHKEASERVLRAVDDLDETIKIIRSTIFGLRPHPAAAPGPACAPASSGSSGDRSAAGLRAQRADGRPDRHPCVQEAADHLVAVLSEALTNVARHARASRAQVAVETDGRELRLTVADDGVGLPGRRRSGLRNMAERAEQLGGSFEVTDTRAAARPWCGGCRWATRSPRPRRGVFRSRRGYSERRSGRGGTAGPASGRTRRR